MLLTIIVGLAVSSFLGYVLAYQINGLVGIIFTSILSALSIGAAIVYDDWKK